MISVLCPTRARPDNMRRLVDSIHRTADRSDLVEVVWYIDEDDHESADVAKELDTRYIVGPRIVLSQMWNTCMEYARGDIVMHCGDDIVFRSPSWDTIVVAQFDASDDKILLVYGDDLYQRQAMATHGFYHRRWVEALGRLVPPYFSSDYNDAWNTEVARTIGRLHYVPTIITEHMHPVAHKAEWDITHRERLDREARDNPSAIYNSKGGERIEDANKLRAAMNVQ